MAPFLVASMTLKKLKATQCSIGEDAVLQFASALQKNTSLEILDLSNNPIQDSGVMALVTALQTNSKLHTLRLMNCNIGEKGGRALAFLIEKNASVCTTLDLLGNRIGITALQALASARNIVPYRFFSKEPIRIVLLGSGGIGAKSAMVIQYIKSLVFAFPNTKPRRCVCRRI